MTELEAVLTLEVVPAALNGVPDSPSLEGDERQSEPAVGVDASGRSDNDRCGKQ